MSIEEKNDKRQSLINKLHDIFVSQDSNWISEEPTTDLTNLDHGNVILVNPVTALSLNEVKSFSIIEDVQGTIETTFMRKS